jgi:hypothetical protein
MHHCNKTTARANIAHTLMARPAWKLYGYKENRSDSMTDYYDPADWYDGAAVHLASGIVFVIDRYSGNATATRARVRHVPDPSNPCSDCQGTGRAFKAEHNPNLAMRYGLAPNGCIPCHGRGHRNKSENYEEPFVAYQATPKGKAWHLERDGQIIASGIGVFTCQKREQAEALVDKIEAMIAKLTGPTKPNKTTAPAIEPAAEPSPLADIAPSEPSLDTGATVKPGKPGNIEIRFTYKPSDEIRAELKAAGYRWLGSAGLWYGPAETLPGRYTVAQSPDPVLHVAPGSGGKVLQFARRSSR